MLLEQNQYDNDVDGITRNQLDYVHHIQIPVLVNLIGWKWLESNRSRFKTDPIYFSVTLTSSTNDERKIRTVDSLT